MIIKNEHDAERFIAHDGRCGESGEFCSQSCAQHGRHVAITGDGRVFARGLPVPHAEGVENATVHRGETITLGLADHVHRSPAAA